jgi:hypothetical protein
MAVALNASLSKKPQASAKPATEEPADRTSKPAAKKRSPQRLDRPNLSSGP